MLDFNRLPEDSAAASFQRFYLRRLVVPVAAAAGLRDQYAYLEQSLKRFPDGAAQVRLALESGLKAARHRSLMAGQMGVLVLER